MKKVKSIQPATGMKDDTKICESQLLHPSISFSIGNVVFCRKAATTAEHCACCFQSFAREDFVYRKTKSLFRHSWSTIVLILCSNNAPLPARANRLFIIASIHEHPVVHPFLLLLTIRVLKFPIPATPLSCLNHPTHTDPSIPSRRFT